LTKGKTEDVIISTLLESFYGFSGVFKFAMAWSYGTPATRKAAREYFLTEASQDLFTCWDAYPKALGECLPKCLIKETPRVYFQVLKDVVARIETQRGICTQA